MTFTILFRNLLHKPLSTLLSIALILLSVGIISLVLLVQVQVQDKFDRDLRDIDMVVGAKGSPLQLVLSAVYQIDAPTGNISLREVNRLRSNPFVEQLIPLAYGDSYKNFRIIGSDTNYCHKYSGKLREGVFFSKPMEAVLGSAVAMQTGLKPGQSFLSNHGNDAKGQVHVTHAYTVVGILAAGNSILDQLILTNIETVWQVHGEKHADHGANEANSAANTRAGEAAGMASGGISPFMVVRKAGQPGVPHSDLPQHSEDSLEITAALLKFRSPMGTLMLPRIINQTTNMQAAVPVLEINRLVNLMGIGIEAIQGIAVAIMLISGLSVFIALYNRLLQRRYEHALIRSLGGSRFTLLWLTLEEGWVLAVVGFVLGMVLSRVGLLLLNNYAARRFHFHFGFAFVNAEFILFLLTIGLGTLAALLPAIKAFRLNISKTLAEG